MPTVEEIRDKEIAKLRAANDKYSDRMRRKAMQESEREEKRKTRESREPKESYRSYKEPRYNEDKEQRHIEREEYRTKLNIQRDRAMAVLNEKREERIRDAKLRAEALSINEENRLIGDPIRHHVSGKWLGVPYRTDIAYKHNVEQGEKLRNIKTWKRPKKFSSDRPRQIHVKEPYNKWNPPLVKRTNEERYERQKVIKAKFKRPR